MYNIIQSDNMRGHTTIHYTRRLHNSAGKIGLHELLYECRISQSRC